MTCGKCKNCVPEDACDCDCKCTTKDLDVSQDDDIRFYGEHDEPCEAFNLAG